MHHCLKTASAFRDQLKKIKGLQLWQRPKKPCPLTGFPEGGRKGSGSTTPLIAAEQTWGSGTASRPASTERDVVVEHAPPRSQEHPSSVTTRRPPSQTLRITSQVQDRQRAAREAVSLPPPPRRARPESFPVGRRRRLSTRRAYSWKSPSFLVNPATDHPRSTRLTNRASYGPQA
jgi:hypothetical protein